MELIGTLEQNTMAIACPDGGADGSPGFAFTHTEFHAGAMLSVVASMTPFSDYNQSPRNMYQARGDADVWGGCVGGGGLCSQQLWAERRGGRALSLSFLRAASALYICSARWPSPWH